MRKINSFITSLYLLTPMIFISGIIFWDVLENETFKRTISADITVISGSMTFCVIILLISAFFHITKLPQDLEIDNESYETLSNTYNPLRFISACEILIYQFMQLVLSITCVLAVSDYSRINWYILLSPTLIFIITRPLKRLNDLKK